MRGSVHLIQLVKHYIILAHRQGKHVSRWRSKPQQLHGPFVHCVVAYLTAIASMKFSELLSKISRKVRKQWNNIDILRYAMKVKVRNEGWGWEYDEWRPISELTGRANECEMDEERQDDIVTLEFERIRVRIQESLTGLRKM